MKKSDKPYGGKLSSLDALFGAAPTAAGEMVPLETVRLNPDQPRRYFGEAELASLAASIGERGVLQPLLVRPLPDGAFELVAGERRYRAARMAGLGEVPAVVRDLSDEEALELSLLENLQREDLNPVEETDAVLRLLSSRLGKSVEDVVATIRSLYYEARGRSGNNVVAKEERETIDALFSALGRLTPSSFYLHRLPLLRLPEELLEAVRGGSLHYTKARELAKVENERARAALLARVFEEEMGLADLKREVKAAGESGKATDEVGEKLKRVKRHLTARRLDGLESKKRKRAEKLLTELEELFEVTTR